MEKVTDWIALWRQLVDIQKNAWKDKKEKKEKKTENDAWKDKAKKFDEIVQKRWSKPDSTRDFITDQIKGHANATIIDIGAGTGAWAVLMAKYALKVTAIEPSDSMGLLLKEKIDTNNLKNIEIIKGSWPDVQLPPHDFSFASHSMYGSSDLKEFVLKMIKCTTKTCFMLLRVPLKDSIMEKAAHHVFGQPYDSPNFQVAYNALLQMGIYPDVLMEKGEGWDPWVHDTIEDALNDVKKRLGLTEDKNHDQFLKYLLENSLKPENNQFIWPVGTRSSLMYWDV